MSDNRPHSGLLMRELLYVSEIGNSTYSSAHIHSISHTSISAYIQCGVFFIEEKSHKHKKDAGYNAFSSANLPPLERCCHSKLHAASSRTRAPAGAYGATAYKASPRGTERCFFSKNTLYIKFKGFVWLKVKV